MIYATMQMEDLEVAGDDGARVWRGIRDKIEALQEREDHSCQ